MVEIILPAGDGYVPIGVEVIFMTNLTTEFGTDFLGTFLTYSWQFDGDSSTSTGASATHTYHHAGEFQVILHVNNVVSNGHDQTTVTVEEGGSTLTLSPSHYHHPTSTIKLSPSHCHHHTITIPLSPIPHSARPDAVESGKC